MMEYLTLDTGSRIPAIANGPDIPVYSAKYKKPASNKIELYCKKAYNKFIVRPRIHRRYVDAVAHSFRVGFSLLDFSAAYGDGKLIGQTIEKSGMNRNELFITSWVSNQAQLKGDTRECILRQIENMGVEYFDLLMFHWPVTDVYLNTWREMVKLYKEGYCRNLGVANCHQHHLEAVINECGIVQAVNQVEVHPLFTQEPLRDCCKGKGIQIESYTAIARMDDRLMRLPKLKSIAEKHKKSIPQVALRWHIQSGMIPCVRSLNKSRQEENIDISDFVITPEEMRTIDNFNINARVRFDPDNCDFTIL